jgi:putative Holliday junction resolvase
VNVTLSEDLPRSGRLIGLDAGERRVGVAISDPEQHLAVPLRTLERRGDGSELRDLAELARSEEAVGLVVGLPLSLSGEVGEQAERAQEFARQVGKQLDLPVAFWDERLSSQEADRLLTPPTSRRDRRGGRRGGEKGTTDVVAATIILQAYLDSRRLP